MSVYRPESDAALGEFFARIDGLFLYGLDHGFAKADTAITSLEENTVLRLGKDLAAELLVRQSATERRLVLAIRSDQSPTNVRGIFQRLESIGFLGLNTKVNLSIEFAAFCKATGDAKGAKAILLSLQAELRAMSELCAELSEIVAIRLANNE